MSLKTMLYTVSCVVCSRKRKSEGFHFESALFMATGDGSGWTWRYSPGGGPISEEFKGETCYRIRTIRNLANPEEVHQPAYTFMPADQFLELYEPVA